MDFQRSWYVSYPITVINKARSLKPKSGPTQKVFSDMVATKASRTAFIGNLMSFLRQYAFDGVDFDWVSLKDPKSL